MYHLHFAYTNILYIFLPIWILLLIYRWKFYKAPVYLFPLTSMISQTPLAKKSHRKTIFFLLRSLILLITILLIARPQWTDSRTQTNVEGIDIIITLDVSGSMQLFDDLQNRQLRINVAKNEALRFVEKRINDPIGIVIFGADSISRCPLTLDKNILKEIIGQIKLGTINQNGTSLATGLATAVNKLRHSKAKSKIIILLTDGQPTQETEKVTIETAINLLKQYNIKVYTIGIGNKNGGYFQTAFGFIEQAADSINEKLLQNIAQETGGKYFRANNPAEMRTIYNTINALEKTKYKTNLFQKYYEAFSSFIWIMLFILITELILKLFIWRGI